MPKYEKPEDLTEESKNLERARQSLIEELEAVNWYQERIDASKDESLRKILELASRTCGDAYGVDKKERPHTGQEVHRT